MAFASIKASAKGGKDFELVPPGVHLAVCSGVIHLGVQPSNNSKYPDKDQVYIKFEIPKVRVKWEKNGEKHEGPATIGRFFGLSIGEKSNLGPFLEGWRGKPFTAAEQESFEVTSILGKVCQLSVVHGTKLSDGKPFAEIQGAFGLIDEQKAAITANPSLGKVQAAEGPLAYTPNDHDAAIYDKLPEWLRKKVDGRVKKPVGDLANENQAATQDFDDDIPF
jgi:hypothetical protein